MRWPVNLVTEGARVRSGVYVMEKNHGGDQMTARPRDVELALPIDDVQVGEYRVYKIRLPFLPDSKNVYANWPAEWKAGRKKKWVRAILKEVQAQDIPLGLQQIGVAAKLVFPSKPKGRAQQRDPQNYAEQTWHYVLDALQYCSYDCWEAATRRPKPGDPRPVRKHVGRCGVVVDDSEGHIAIGPNWGIQFAYDLRPELPKERRSRTILSITMKVPPSKGGS
jgi:hypothetical protein